MICYFTNHSLDYGCLDYVLDATAQFLPAGNCERIPRHTIVSPVDTRHAWTYISLCVLISINKNNLPLHVIKCYIFAILIVKLIYLQSNVHVYQNAITV